MKFNKKLIVPFLSTVVGLSIAGGLGGAFAWYQYNTQVTASFVGTSVADSSVLQIGHYEIDSQTQQQVMVWGKDFYPYASGVKQKMIPVTFGALSTIGGVANSIPTNAYGYPEARVSGDAVNPGYDNWATITPEDTKGFVRFDMYLRALAADGSQLALKVFLSDLLIKAAAEDDGSKEITPAVRVHLAVDGGTNRLLAKNAVNALPLYGPLDLDGVDGNDTTGGYVLPSGEYAPKTVITYGRNGETQTALGESDIEAVKTNGKYGTDQADKMICTTKTDSFVKITVTAWLEGWANLKVDGDGNRKPVWNPAYSAGVDIQFGMTFDTGVVRTDN